MPTNNPNRMQQQQQAIVLQQIPTTLNVQQTTSPKKMIKTAVSWNKPSDDTRNPNVEVSCKALIQNIRENLSNLRHLHKALMNAKCAELPYQKEYLNKTDEYDKLLHDVNELERADFTQNTVIELKIIMDKLTFDRVRIDSIFPEITDKAMQMDEQMTEILDKIGFEDFHDKAEVELNQIKASEQKMILEDKKNDEYDDAKASISSAVYMISIFNEMKESEKQIIALKAQNDERAKRTKNSFLIGMGVILLAFVILLFSFYKLEIEWKDIKDYPLLGIPLGVCIWSFIGSFAAMLTQFNKEPIEKFGDPLKWVIIRPVLGIVMGAAIYLALFSLVLTGKSQNDLLPLLVAFFVGYSDTFTYDIMASIQKIISSLFSSTNTEDIKNNIPAPVYMVAPNTQPVAPVVVTQPVETHHTNQPDNNNPSVVHDHKPEVITSAPLEHLNLDEEDLEKGEEET